MRWLAVAAAFGFTGAAAAQEIRQDDSAIIVTARRVAERLDRVPLSLTVLTRATLADRTVIDTRDLQMLAPSLTLATAGWRNATGFALRGQTTGTYSGSTPAVQSYFAGVPQLFGGAVRPFYDLASVEILRGPQGTLFGRASNGGAILFAPVRPARAAEVDASLRLGSFAHRELAMAATVPLDADGAIAARVAGQIVRRHGFTRLVDGGRIDGKHSDALRLGLRWTASPAFEAYLVADHLRIDQSVGSSILRGRPRPCAVGAAGIAGLASCVYGPGLALLTGGQLGYGQLATARPAFAAYPDGLQDAYRAQLRLGPRKVALAGPTLSAGDANKADLVALETRLSLPLMTLRNIAAYQFFSARSGVDQDGTIFPILENAPVPANHGYQFAYRDWSDEIQLGGRTGAWTWVAGAFAEAMRPHRPSLATFLLMSAINPTVGSVTNDERTSRYALFGQADVAIGRSLHVTLGARRSWDRTAVGSRRLAQPYDVATGRFGAPTCAEPAALTYGMPYDAATCIGPAARTHSAGTNWTAGIDRRRGATLLYLASHHGYRSAGLNASLLAPALRRFGAEGLTDAEFGLKTRIGTEAALNATLDLAAYHAWMRHVQRQIFVTDPSTGQLATITANAARAHIDGGEMRAVVAWRDRIAVETVLGYVDARYDRFDIPALSPGGTLAAPADGRGNRFANTPRLTSATTLRIAAPTHWRARLQASMTWYRQSRFFFSDENIREAEGVAPAYSLLGARIDWQDALRPGLDLALFARNLTNRAYVLGGQSLQSQLGITVASYGEPRMIGIEIRFRGCCGITAQ